MKKYFIIFLTGSFVAGRPCLPLIKGIKYNWAITDIRIQNINTNKYSKENWIGIGIK